MYFYFDELFRTALNGLNATAVPTTMVNIAQTILIATLIWNVFEAWTRGGDVRMVGIGFVKYLIFGLILQNFGAIFLGVSTMFNQVAEFISTVGPGGKDVFDTWTTDVGEYWKTSPTVMRKMWSFVTGGIPGAIESGLLMIGYLIYAITYPLFCIFYAFYGSILYICAPLVLALYPALSTTGIARTYLTNLLIFHSWGLIYAILGCLMSAIHLGTVAEVLARGDAAGFFAGTGEALLLGLASILMALSIFFIPMLASRIVRGDVGSTMFALASAATTAATVIASSAMNVAGAALHARGGGGGGGNGGGPGGPGGGNGKGAAEKSSQMPPPTPPAEKSQQNPSEGKSSQESPKGPAEKAVDGPTGGDSGTNEGKSLEGGKNAETADGSKESGSPAPKSGKTDNGGGGRNQGGNQKLSNKPTPYHPQLYTPMRLSQIAAAGIGTAFGRALRSKGDGQKEEKD